ncbi:SO2930 family diheme c-type cytochrome [Marinobacter sp. F4206]|uniref:SO2930 family diheme c-type cytochrome n=1 Tax=Marinobacter sp. F4206 TaxID=2861777 RepID=UPI001C5F8DBF|nr:SO2930 family diheme c-type cytochrome [Marinobacter sp. F4206]MBW4935379.1 hypothetical protein [Marinobacter sp. F4206]
MTTNKNTFKYWLTGVTAALTLSACGGGGGGSDNATNAGTGPSGSALNAGAGAPSGTQGDCTADTQGVNWDALMTQTCRNLSDYRLFQDPTDPTANPSTGGVPYDLSTALFTDYTSKYRFVFIPEGKTASYTENEVLDFPVGTVITKTFALPENTAFRDGAETVIETRLLIHRDSGWVAIPYYWSSSEDATLAISGKSIPDMTTNHNGAEIAFTYSVPTASDCTSCHSVVPVLQDANDKREPIFLPIGPKARYLNHDYDYAGTVYNQLAYWAEGGILTGLPADMQSVTKAPVFNDLTTVSALNDEQLMDTAKAYLDINCAHCHRSGLTLPENYAGAAGGSGLQVEYNRAYADDPGKFGTCKTPVAGGHPDYSADVVPQDADDSYLLFRVSTNDNRHRMPELGRSVVHQEGVELIKSWINFLPAASCSPPA